MASSGSSENEGLAELLKETLKELRNISSELGEQSKAIRAMTKTHCRPLSPAAEQPTENDTFKNRTPISVSTLVGQPARLDYGHRSEERGFWGDTDERFFSEMIPLDYLEFASTPMDPDYFTALIASESRSVITPPYLSADEHRITASSAMNSALDNSVASSFRRASNSSEMENAPQTASAQSFERPNTSSTMINAPDISNI
ncbi:hypothetical protein BCON_0505g00040 [Botryotinia convoluta]|uniref:Uncharacterized protein n=1 Tax=Botryotinia convoluta TaxID=54673 RepID=A0A4Z1H8N7_9HELO|nr:hypothetical protein BCON_0505g00040 [Botryotinia convoluta]